MAEFDNKACGRRLRTLINCQTLSWNVMDLISCQYLITTPPLPQAMVVVICRRTVKSTCLREYFYRKKIHNVSVKFLKWLDWTRKSVIFCKKNAFVPRTHLLQIVTWLNPLTMIGLKVYCKIWQFPGLFIWMAWMACFISIYHPFFLYLYHSLLFRKEMLISSELERSRSNCRLI